MRDSSDVVPEHGLTSGNGVEREFSTSTLALLVDTLLGLVRAGYGVILVTSGAVGVGCKYLGWKKRPTSLSEKQAAAAVGQTMLMRTYGDLFRINGQYIAEVLLTRRDFSRRSHYLNAKNTLLSLCRFNVIPIINENDSVATDELQFGDNDSLSAFVGGMVEAKWLFLLTDVDRLYSGDPRSDPAAKPISLVRNVNELSVTFGKGSVGGTQWGTGGMSTKVNAARLATAAGVRMCIIHGQRPERILEFVQGKAGTIGTVFEPHMNPIRGDRKRWIAMGLQHAGNVVIDRGAVDALHSKKSLFAAGVVSVQGEFLRDQSVRILDLDGKEIARGLTNYNSRELNQMKGKRSEEIEKELEIIIDGEVINRDNIALV
eukprot:CAMPEP_0184688078 /NCGR_PEP_ID=MMETSP0312-20130426/28463_1 /TAXON_ID=31354 /ORGANISM="Compsopogon coeruleus, Strain SAG 36.94" /LENGTH=372 /DNA_ID=CAMNT_0027144823 /DNA_START=473 /DNA_END=1591 /DNA_ORIENTATION=-